MPTNRFELIDLLRESNALDERIGTYDIETSGVGYLFAFEDAIQASTWGRLVESFGRNRAQLFCCTSEILDRVADGRLIVGYNVLGSYALERIARDDRIGMILPSDYTLILSRAVFVSRDTRAPDLAAEFPGVSAFSARPRTAVERLASALPDRRRRSTCLTRRISTPRANNRSGPSR